MSYETPKQSGGGGVDAVVIQNSSYVYAEDAEANDSYAITLDPAIEEYADGQTFKFKANTANTGASSLNVNGLGAKTIKKNNDQDTATGDIEAGSIVVVTYDADDDVFKMVSADANVTQDEIGDGVTNRSYTDTEKTKLAGIEESADVTDAGNVGSVMNSATGKTTPVDADTVPITDTEASNVIKKVTLTNLKAFLKTYFDTLYQAVGGGGGVPTGTIAPYAGATAPTDWLLADGSAVSRTTYSDLFALISTTYGAGDGSTTFNLPNLKGRVPVGLDSAQTEFDALAETGGAKTHALTIAEMPAHTHSVSTYANAGSNGIGAGDDAGAGNFNTASQGSGTAHNNLQPYMVVNYIIKT